MFRSCRLLLITLLLPLPVWGQNSVPTISVQGTADLSKQPEVIRLMIKQYGRGKDQDEAKTALVAVEKKLITKLNAAGAEVIVAHAAVALPSQQLQSRYMNVYNTINQRRMGLGGGNPMQERSNPTCLERQLTVDMKPKAKDKEIMTLLADLQERIRKDYQELCGMQDALPKDDDNVNRGEISYYRNDTSLYNNDVRFQMAAKITREDRVKLYAEALRRAKSIANDLAEAADMKAGPVQTISSNFTNQYMSY
ncbi:MAG TPA: SIMPL domain-containing protein, partial [Gemmatales bacterium]|nr:SIMPL domain-containing protein [Gemmatales bacterium]